MLSSSLSLSEPSSSLFVDSELDDRDDDSDPDDSDESSWSPEFEVVEVAVEFSNVPLSPLVLWEALLLLLLLLRLDLLSLSLLLLLLVLLLLDDDDDEASELGAPLEYSSECELDDSLVFDEANVSEALVLPEDELEFELSEVFDAEEAEDEFEAEVDEDDDDVDEEEDDVDEDDDDEEEDAAEALEATESS